MGSPWFCVTISAVYVYLAKVALPRFTQNRPAYNLDGVIAVYNVLQISLCAEIVRQVRPPSFQFYKLVREYANEGNLYQNCAHSRCI